MRVLLLYGSLLNVLENKFFCAQYLHAGLGTRRQERPGTAGLGTRRQERPGTRRSTTLLNIVQTL